MSTNEPTPDVASFHLLSSPYLKNGISSRKNHPVLLFCFNQKYSVSSSFISLFSSTPQAVSFSSHPTKQSSLRDILRFSSVPRFPVSPIDIPGDIALHLTKCNKTVPSNFSSNSFSLGNAALSRSGGLCVHDGFARLIVCGRSQHVLPVDRACKVCERNSVYLPGLGPV